MANLTITLDVDDVSTWLVAQAIAARQPGTAIGVKRWLINHLVAQTKASNLS